MRLFFCFALLALAGCATTAPQTKALLMSPPNIAETTEIKNVPFIEQEAGQCGPATLTMAMQWAGRNLTVDQIVPKVMTPEKKGSLQEDMISASRREGMMAIHITGMDALLREIAAGHPVIIFENLGLSWYPRWHYAIIFGYDLKKEELIMHSGRDAFDRIDMRIFERSWKLSDYWALVVLNPNEISYVANEIENMRAAAGLEQVGKTEEAQKAYQKILERWPTSLSALIGLSNLAYVKKDFKSAVQYLSTAKTFHPESSVVAHNLKIAKSAYKNR